MLWLLWMGWSEVDGWVMVVDAERDRLVLWWWLYTPFSISEVEWHEVEERRKFPFPIFSSQCTWGVSNFITFLPFSLFGSLDLQVDIPSFSGSNLFEFLLIFFGNCCCHTFALLHLEFREHELTDRNCTSVSYCSLSGTEKVLIFWLDFFFL